MRHFCSACSSAGPARGSTPVGCPCPTDVIFDVGARSRLFLSPDFGARDGSTAYLVTLLHLNAGEIARHPRVKAGKLRQGASPPGHACGGRKTMLRRTMPGGV